MLFSPGYAQDRALGTTLVEDLASRGYVVASIDHTYDATEVEFPGNRLVLRQQPEPTEEMLVRSTEVRSADAQLVLDKLTSLDLGENPDAEHHGRSQSIWRLLS